MPSAKCYGFNFPDEQCLLTAHHSDDAQQQDPEDIYTSEYEVGQDNLQGLGLDIHNPVFLISSVTVVVFVTITLMFPEQAASNFSTLRLYLTGELDWFFMYSMNGFLIFSVALALSPLGAIRIGGPTAKARYHLLSWISMLFAAGIGIGIMFYGVLEPMNHALTPPLNAENLAPDELRQLAMASTIYHWAFHPWAVYVVIGLSLSFFCYNKGLPLLIRSALYPIFGERIWGWPGHIVDILAIFATLFGLATSLGYGAEQAAGGLNYLFELPTGDYTNIALVLVITALALISVVRGLDGGIKRLSEINMVLAALLGTFVLFMTPVLDTVSAFFTYILAYLEYLPVLSSWDGRTDFYYMHDWTTFYWSWWIAFSPFVGMFIARISSGRTVREFVFGALLAPSLIFMLWMTIFGHTAIDQYFNSGIEGVAESVRNFQPELTLFIFLEEFPLTLLTSIVGLCLVIIFFVTSMDSGSLVVDTMAAGGKIKTPLFQRIFWCVALGMIGIALLLGGGLSSVQAVSLASAFPFTLIIILMVISLLLGLVRERRLLAAENATTEDSA
jgi:BCCT family betaine/carnitine transporter